MNDPAATNGLVLTLVHDIRTPLNAMMLKLTILEETLAEQLGDAGRFQIESLRFDIRAIVDLLSGVLSDVERLERGTLAEECEFALDNVLSDCVRLVEALAQHKGLLILLDLNSSAIVRSDRWLIQHVIGNLLSNAVRYTERGYVGIRSGVDGCGVWIEVRDTGIGIASEDQARIFDEFFRTDSAREAGEGLGLGLAMARRMAGLMGGDLTVQSERGVGSVFTLSLPRRLLLSPPPAGQSVNGSRRPSRKDPTMGPVRAQVQIMNEYGMHMPGALEFVKLAQGFSAEVQVSRDSKIANGKSILELMGLAAECGARLDLATVGNDAHDALLALCELVMAGFPSSESRSRQDA
jgi:phosphotransferase system HPr (HPr) family protein